MRALTAIDVRDLDEEAQFDEGEINRRNWMMGGRKIEEVPAMLNKEQFSQALRDGLLELHDRRFVYYTETGMNIEPLELSLSGNSNQLGYNAKQFLKANGDKAVYPDANDEHLKTAVAKWMRKNNSPSVRASIASFLRTLFGENFSAAMDSYGEQCPMDEVREKVKTLIAANMAQAENDEYSVNGNTPFMVYTALATNGGTAGAWVTRATGSPRSLFGDYANQKDFEDEFEAQRNNLRSAVDQRLIEAVNKYAADTASMVKALTQGDVSADIERINTMLRERGRSNSWKGIYQGMEKTPEGLNMPRMFADAVIAGFCNLTDITPTMIANYTLRQDLLASITKRLEVTKDYDEWLLGVELEHGLVTPEEVAAAEAKKAELVAEQAANNPNVVIKKNESNLRGGKSTNRYDYATGECWCLHDLRDGGGALKEAKDELKAQPYGASYYSNKRDPNAELVGSWWLIDATRATAAELAAIIQRYE